MKSVFLIQDFSFNKRINYHAIADQVKDNLYLIVYHTNQAMLDEYIKNNNLENIFIRTIAYDTLDLNTVKDFINECNFQINPISIVTNSENAVLFCGQLRKELHLSNDDMLRYVDKIEMKRALINHPEICLPRFINFSYDLCAKNSEMYFESLVKKLGLPMFAKPSNQYSSIGAKRINSYSDFELWYNKCNPHENYEIDELISGILYHCDSFVKNGKILHTQVCEYLHPCYEFIEGKPLGSFTLPSGNDIYEALQKYNDNLLKIFGLPENGLTHLEVFKRDNGELVFLEVAARPAGAQVPNVYQKALNISLREAHILLHIDPQYFPKINLETYAAFISYPKMLGVVEDLQLPKIKSALTVGWEVRIGQELKNPTKISDVAVNIVIWNNSIDVLKQDIITLKNFNPVVLKARSVAPCAT